MMVLVSLPFFMTLSRLLTRNQFLPSSFEFRSERVLAFLSAEIVRALRMSRSFLPEPSEIFLILVA